MNSLTARLGVTIITLGIVLVAAYVALRPVQPGLQSGCDQSSTTTDCSKLPLSTGEQQPYVPPDAVQPDTTWTSAAGAPITLFGFTFELPAGWHGEVYSSLYEGTVHVLVQRESTTAGFTIDCPPIGKGLEAATRLTSESRTFTTAGMSYTVAFEKWTAPGNDPWFFVWVRTAESGDSLSGSAGTYCLVQGAATPDIETAMREMYSTWDAAK